MNRRLELIADIEGTDRLVNDIVAAATRGSGPKESFRCECGHETCHEHVLIPRDLYERVRQDPMLFILQPGHELPEAEDIVRTADTYEIVRKHEELRPVLERTDPRIHDEPPESAAAGGSLS